MFVITGILSFGIIGYIPYLTNVIPSFPNPSPITTECNRHEMLPDHDYRRGVHLTDESWSCNCKEPWQQYDFEGKLVTAFSELLERGAPDLCDSYCGKEDIKMGDGYLALPTLIHRGPGNASSSAEPRYMLFFTLRPQYANATSSAAHYHKYNPDLQIHAGKFIVFFCGCVWGQMCAYLVFINDLII